MRQGKKIIYIFYNYFFNNYSLLDYNEIMIDIYAKKHQKELICVLNKYQVPIDILEVIENNIKNDYQYWIPFAPAEDLWKWDFTDFSVNMRRVENLKIEVEPAQKSTNLYFITYNILNIIHGMAGLKFAYQFPKKIFEIDEYFFKKSKNV